MSHTERVSRLLAEFRSLSKFGPLSDGLYTGIHDHAQRVAAETAINELVDHIVRDLAPTFAHDAVLGAFAGTLDGLDLSDTEDREQACNYLEAIMDIIGIESSDSLLMNWMYGFDPDEA